MSGSPKENQITLGALVQLANVVQNALDQQTVLSNVGSSQELTAANSNGGPRVPDSPTVPGTITPAHSLSRGPSPSPSMATLTSPTGANVRSPEFSDSDPLADTPRQTLANTPATLRRTVRSPYPPSLSPMSSRPSFASVLSQPAPSVHRRAPPVVLSRSSTSTPAADGPQGSPGPSSMATRARRAPGVPPERLAASKRSFRSHKCQVHASFSCRRPR